jgi:hypothetical protein
MVSTLRLQEFAVLVLFSMAYSASRMVRYLVRVVSVLEKRLEARGFSLVPDLKPSLELFLLVRRGALAVKQMKPHD